MPTVKAKISLNAQSDQGLHCPLTEALHTTECMNGEQMPIWNFPHAQHDLNLLILHMLEGTFVALAVARAM